MTATRGLLIRPAAWTLRTRLLVGLVGVMAAISLIIGFVGVVALDRFLGAQLDSQLTEAERRSQTFDEGPRGEPDHARPPDFAPGQGSGTLLARVAGGQVSAAVLDANGTRVAVPAAAAGALTDVRVGGAVTTVDLGNPLGDYRVAAVRASDGDVLVTGLPLQPVHATVYRMAAVVAAVSLLGLLAAAAAGAYVVRLGLRPLRRVSTTAARVAELPLDRGEVALAERVPAASADPRTEVGQVGAALNRLLEHLASALQARQESETRVRHFVADASHELRTPLASIRGYAELTRPYRPEIPADVARALDRVESESVRMSGLVDDLLLLARLDSGRPLDLAPVDLTGLLVDSVGDAYAAGPQHDWTLRLPDEPVLVRADAARLRQVVANLLANARTHTPPGTRVDVGLSAESDQAILGVGDDGPGIPETLVPEAFQRFVRGDSSRSRAHGSTGLGLSIVASVVEAHGGSVALRSRPGRTEVTVRLPLLPAGEAQQGHSSGSRTAQHDLAPSPA